MKITKQTTLGELIKVMPIHSKITILKETDYYLTDSETGKTTYNSGYIDDAPDLPTIKPDTIEEFLQTYSPPFESGAELIERFLKHLKDNDLLK